MAKLFLFLISSQLPYLVSMSKIQEFIAAVDAAFFNRCSAAKGSESSIGGGCATRYYNVQPVPVSVWISCEEFGGEVSATVCNDEGVMTCPEKVADGLVQEARWRLEEAGVKPAF